MAIFITSDLHFGHNKDFLYGKRGYDTVWEMSEDIVRKWNEVVGVEDTVYVLGDITVGAPVEDMVSYINRLNGEIYACIGNHDSENKIAYMLMESKIQSFEFAYRIRSGKYNFFISHYPTLCSNFDADKALKRQVINLCGHSHTFDRFQDMGKGLIYHCELEAHDMKPVNIEDIKKEIKEYYEVL